MSALVATSASIETCFGVDAWVSCGDCTHVALIRYEPGASVTLKVLLEETW